VDPVVDAESGLIYLRARYYDPATGQFMSRDPLAAATGDPYGYAGGDPLNGTDPSGLLCLTLHCIIDDMGAGAHAVVTVSARGEATVIRLSPIGVALTAASQATGKTVGFCEGGDLLGGIDINANLCYLATPSGQFGITASLGGGAGAPIGLGALIGPTVSNAKSLNDLSGLFAYGWSTAGELQYSGGASVELGRNSCGKTIWQGTAGWAPGLDLPIPFSVGAGANYTWTAASY
jgi:RHS repeat-associated protein